MITEELRMSKGTKTTKNGGSTKMKNRSTPNKFIMPSAMSEA
jgi:hypothetical protein